MTTSSAFSLGLGVTVTDLSVRHGVEEIPAVNGFASNYRHSGEHTVTVKGRTEDGGWLTVSATAFGPEGVALAGWRAFGVLLSAKTPVGVSAREQWMFAESKWVQTGCSEEVTP